MSNLQRNMEMAIRHLQDANSDIRRHAILKAIAKSCNREIVQIEKDFGKRVDRKLGISG